MEMLTSLAVLRLCRSSRFIRNADRWMETSRGVLGDRLTHSIIKRSFFQQFCPGNPAPNDPVKVGIVAGTNGEEALEKIRRLAAHGIGCMFDWVPTAEPPSSTTLPAFREAVDANMKVNASFAVSCF